MTISSSSPYIFVQVENLGKVVLLLLNLEKRGINGTTIAFNLSAMGSSHPFLIQNSSGANYDTGLVHVATDGTCSLGSNAQGKESGTLYWKIPSSISGTYRYQCSSHSAMVGAIIVKNFGSI